MKSFEYTIKDELGIHKRWENEKTDAADDANVTWRKAGRYRNRCSKRRGRRCSD